MANHTPEQNILDRLNHWADGLDNLRNNSKDDYDRAYIGAMIEEVELMISLAPRIMVCLDACNGLSNEDLKNGALFSAAGIELFGENNEIKILSKQLAAVIAQRDELLEALKVAKSWLEGWASAEHELAVIRSAIEKCEVQNDEQ